MRSTGRYELFDRQEPGNLTGCHCSTDEVEVGQEEKIELKIGPEEIPGEKRRQFDTVGSLSGIYGHECTRTLYSRKKG